ncbi:MAG: UPF0175 family protein [Candidatus Aerophobetes bacterium]|nr:UPF0175 family protein [Candidatus Aerophobetes bacterium]
MPKIKTVLEIPEDAYLALSASGYSKEKIARDAKELLAARLFKIGTLSLGKAAELAEMSLPKHWEKYLTFTTILRKEKNC